MDKIRIFWHIYQFQQNYIIFQKVMSTIWHLINVFLTDFLLIRYFRLLFFIDKHSLFNFRKTYPKKRSYTLIAPFKFQI